MFWSVPMWVRVSDDILVTLTIAPESASMCGTTSSQPTIVMHNLTGTSLGGDFYMFCLYFYLGLGWVYSGLPLSYVAWLPVTINVNSICWEPQKYLVASELLWIILYVPSYLHQKQDKSVPYSHINQYSCCDSCLHASTDLCHDNGLGNVQSCHANIVNIIRPINTFLTVTGEGGGISLTSPS